MLRLLLLFAGILFPLTVAAQVGALPGRVDFVSGGLGLTMTPPAGAVTCGVGAVGGCQIAATFVFAVQRARLLASALGMVIAVAAGFRLIISTSDEAFSTARRTILGVVVGLFVIFITEPIVEGVYGGLFTITPGDALLPGNIPVAAEVISLELRGILAWVETLVAVVAIGLIIVQAVTVLGSFGNEDRIRKAYRAVFTTIFGILFVIFDQAVARVFGFNPASAGLPVAPTTAPLYQEAFGLVRFLLMFIAIIVVGVIIYAAGLMLLHYGNDEMITRARTILINAAIGLTLIIVSFVIVSTVIIGL